MSGGRTHHQGRPHDREDDEAAETSDGKPQPGEQHKEGQVVKHQCKIQNVTHSINLF